MNDTQRDSRDFNRRDFLKGGSVATLMTMLGGVELVAQTAPAPAAAKGPKVKVAVIGLGPWGREIVNTLALLPEAEVVALCDTYPAAIKRLVNANPNPAPGATSTPDYKTILENKDIRAVIVATPTHQHKEIVQAALKAGKHVYCEAPLAHTIAEAKEIALAAKAADQCLFQPGLQLRSDPQRLYLLPHFRSGGLGKLVMARSQYHKKQSWRSASPNPEREKEINWRLDKSLSLGLIGEIGIHALDQAAWFLNGSPALISGFGSLLFQNQDGREVFDTVQATVEYPGGARLIFDATLANSFDGSYDLFFGSDAALMLRESKAWMFKETDSPLGGWEVYAKKETFYKETGIVLKAGGSKSTDQGDAKEVPYKDTPLSFALTNFLRNAADMTAAKEDFIANYGEDDKGLAEALAKVGRRPAAGYQEGFNATVMAIKANEAVVNKQVVTFKPEWYELG